VKKAGPFFAGHEEMYDGETRIEADALAKRVSELASKLDRPESTAKLNEISFLNHIILQKEFSWTRLVGVLEAAPASTSLA